MKNVPFQTLHWIIYLKKKKDFIIVSSFINLQQFFNVSTGTSIIRGKP